MRDPGEGRTRDWDQVGVETSRDFFRPFDTDLRMEVFTSVSGALWHPFPTSTPLPVSLLPENKTPHRLSDHIRDECLGYNLERGKEERKKRSVEGVSWDGSTLDGRESAVGSRYREGHGGSGKKVPRLSTGGPHRDRMEVRDGDFYPPLVARYPDRTLRGERRTSDP